MWFIVDQQGKLVKTGGWNLMAFRRNQDGFRKYMRNPQPGMKVHLIDIFSGMKSERDLDYATKTSRKKLRDEMVAEMLGLTKLSTW